MECCPQCGQKLPVKNNSPTPYQQRILDIVKRAGDDGIGSDDLFDKLYADDPDGGPLVGRQSLYNIVRGLNTKLEKHGMRVRAVPNGRRAPWSYVLEHINYG